MNKIMMLCAAGAAALLFGAAPAMAQSYGYGYDQPAPYRYATPYDSGYPAAYDGRGGYDPHRETFVGPNGYEYTRCRPHRGCYNPGPSY